MGREDERKTMTVRQLGNRIRELHAAAERDPGFLDQEVVLQVFNDEDDDSLIGGLFNVQFEHRCNDRPSLILSADCHAIPVYPVEPGDDNEIAMPKFETYAYSVLDVAQSLHCHATGTCVEMSDEEMRTLLAWLRWRVSDGWRSAEEYGNTLAAAEVAAQNAVRAFGSAVVAECDRRLAEDARGG